MFSQSLDIGGENMINVPIYEKELLTLEEAAAITGIGTNKLRSMSNSESCEYVIWNGNRRLFKRKKLFAYLEQCYSI